MDLVFDAVVLGGVCVFLIGIIYSNVVVYAMAKHWNRTRSREEQVPAWAAWGKGAYPNQTIGKYRQETGDGSLYKQLKIAYRVCGTSAVFAVVAWVLGYILKRRG